MRIIDAINILKPLGNDAAALKAAYREAAKKYHPDHGGDTEMMKMINAAMDMLSKNVGAWRTHWTNANTVNPNRESTIDETIMKKIKTVRRYAGLNIEVCGVWVWVSGTTWKYSQPLKKDGFRWAPAKKMWYWHSPEHKPGTRKQMSIEWIRSKYGSEQVQTEPMESIA